MVAKALGVPPEKVDITRIAAPEPVNHVLAEMNISY
jgi:hypothetical protein